MKEREEETYGIFKNRIFYVVDIGSIGKENFEFGSTLVDILKRIDDGYMYKSRLVTQNYSDKLAATIAAKASTVQHFTQRLLLSLADSMDENGSQTTDITQGCI